MEKDKSTLEFLYAGDIWPVLWGDKWTKHIGTPIVKTMQKGKPFFVTQDFSFLEYSYKNSLIKFNSVLKHEKDKNLLYSIFPHCEGAENDVVLCDMIGCDDNIEGYIKLQKK